MSTITTAVRNFVDDENGVTAIEYGLIAALIAGVIAGVVGVLGVTLSGMFTTLNSKL
ncbi:MAG: Flp family type IVb pilin [Pseudomonadota bacterium]